MSYYLVKQGVKKLFSHFKHKHAFDEPKVSKKFSTYFYNSLLQHPMVKYAKKHFQFFLLFAIEMAILSVI